MAEAGLPPSAIERFQADYERLVAGDAGYISEEELLPVTDLPRLEALQVGPQSSQNLAALAVIKLNGGLGTSMGLLGPKGALPVSQGLSFLAITALQISSLQKRLGAGLPLVLMNSFATREESLKILREHNLQSQVSLDFLQSKVPKVEAAGFAPATYPQDPELEWCPPGHGEIYSALKSSGILAELLEKGYRYAFVSNVDNLGASVDPRILDWFVENQLDFAMEVTRRTEHDRKGGHLALRKSDGRLTLREVAQCPADQTGAFEDIERYRYFNTNNLWLNLESIARLEKAPLLPLIVNRKTVNPSDRTSTPVIQLESAMGAAISSFARSAALDVDRSRFLPVKNTTDLLRLSSDLYKLDEDYQLRWQGQGDGPTLSLDDQIYRNFPEWQKRFPHSAGLLGCSSLKIEGDVSFLSASPVFRGEVRIHAEAPGRLDGPGPFEGDIKL